MQMLTSLILIALLLLLATASPAGPACATFTPKEDPAAVLHNPDMGWVVYEDYPVDQRPNGASNITTLPDETFPEADEVAVMFSWADVEKTQGVYDFSKVDYAYDYWKSRGKKIQLRMSTESHLWWDNLDPPTGIGVPDYVLAKLPPDSKQVRTCEGLPYTVVDARHPFYQGRLKAFLKAVDEHYKTRPVTLIDLRGFGLWGEWHTGYKYPSTEARVEALRSIIDIWSSELKGHTLALSFSYDPDGPPSYHAGPTDHLDPAYTNDYAAYAHYSAFDYALAKPNITLRRDGCGGAIHSNERLLVDKAFGLGKAPIFSEFMDGYHASKKGGEAWLNWKVEDALSIHPNYVALLGWQCADARDFCRERPDLIKLGLLNMGYRLVPIEITLPTKMQPGETYQLTSLWANRANGRALVDFHLKLLFTDPTSRKPACEIDLGPIPTTKWTKGSYYAVNRDFTLPDIAPGSYDLAIQLTDPRTGHAIHLPLKTNRVCGVEINARSHSAASR